MKQKFRFLEYNLVEKADYIDDGMVTSAGVAITFENQVLIAKPAGYANDMWSFPKGEVDGVEKLVDAALREVAEELNIVLKKSKMTKQKPVFVEFLQDIGIMKRLYVFHYPIAKLSEIELDDLEVDDSNFDWEIEEAKFVPYSKAMKLLEKGQRPILKLLGLK